MVIAKNLSTLHILNVLYNILKPWYPNIFPLAWLLVLNLLLLTSCLNQTTRMLEYSPDAQIYAFSLSSPTDTSDVLPATNFYH